jgi:hypothetical protein
MRNRQNNLTKCFSVVIYNKNTIFVVKNINAIIINH